ncbi:MAG TPA: hypothetical protein VK563_18190 [Puia sp.]|nr:hypothetical protein [Puia sp.]
MKLIPLLIPLLLIIAVSCSKSGYTTKPQITITSINTIIDSGGNLDVKLKFTDKQGDLGMGQFTSMRTRLNQRPPSNGGTADTVFNQVPSFPNLSTGEFEFTLPYQILNESTQENDTVIFKFAVVDRAGNKSDTITSPKVVVLYH